MECRDEMLFPDRNYGTDLCLLFKEGLDLVVVTKETMRAPEDSCRSAFRHSLA